MKEDVKDVIINGVKTKAVLLFIDENDRPILRKMYDNWRVLNVGMKSLSSRGINIPEGISESAFCLEFNKNCARAIKVLNGSGSFDALDIKTGVRIQVKACSVKNELTSFGPKSVWDELYFLDFYREGNYDGTFDVYKIPNELIYSHKVNANQTLKEQQAQNRRPRFSIKKEIIAKNNLKPIKTCKI